MNTSSRTAVTEQVVDLKALCGSPARIGRLLAHERGSTPDSLVRRVRVEGPLVRAEYRHDDGFSGTFSVICIDRSISLLLASYSSAPPVALACRADGCVLLQLRLEGEALLEDGRVAARAAITTFPPGSRSEWSVTRSSAWRTLALIGTFEAIERRWQLGAALRDAVAAQEGADDVVARRRPWAVRSGALEILRVLLDFEAPGKVARAYFEARAQQLCCEFLLAGPAATEDARPSRRRHEPIARAREILLADPAGPHTLASLARRAGISRTVLAAGFRAEFGETVYEFLQRERLERAWVLIEASRTKVAAVARQVGYRDPASFTRAFRSRFGLTPTEAAAQSQRRDARATR